MRGLLILIVAVVPFVSGCDLIALTEMNTVNETHIYSDEQHLKSRAFLTAQDAWLEYLAHQPPDVCPPPAFEHGFVDGFADYLLYGGNGSPPAVPPIEYRRREALSPAGHKEILDYFAGFSAGSAAATASGLRTYYVLPISSPLPTESRYQEKATESKTEPTEILPQPKPVEAKELPPPKPVEGKPMSLRGPVLPPAAVAVPATVEMTPGPQLARPRTLSPAAILLEPPPLSVGPATPVTNDMPPALPREFAFPLLGGAGSR